MYQIVIETNDPEAVLRRVSKKIPVNEEVRVRDMDTKRIGVYDLNRFKPHPIRKFFKSLFLGILGLLALIGALFCILVWGGGLIIVHSEFGVDGLYVVAGSILATFAWPFFRKRLNPPIKDIRIADSVEMPVQTAGMAASQLHSN